ncbi:uncharacterized protein [Lolium perenne]|jgi:hypothetical protein|uniref:uncharacterized protein n=1 Tax=Lolium perenne TaxID=4522 RepID=UPI0021E9E532|nr:uncharacterized protein LOC127340709 [Lolium perenne]XP_051222425.1 uncharacterized protein LOC127340709 [Lolium perenne]
MEADLKTQASIAVGMLRGVALANSSFDYIAEALRTVHAADIIMTSQPEEQPDTADEQLASIQSIAFACREVAELELSVEAAVKIINRWIEANQSGIEPNQTGLQGLPVAAWRVREVELVGTVVRARQRLELAAASCYRSCVVLDVARLGWSTFPLPVRNAWMRYGRQALISTSEYLNDSRDNLTKMCAAAVEARDAAKVLIDLL